MTCKAMEVHVLNQENKSHENLGHFLEIRLDFQTHEKKNLSSYTSLFLFMQATGKKKKKSFWRLGKKS